MLENSIEKLKPDQIFEMFEKEKTRDVLVAIRSFGYSKADHTEDDVFGFG